MTSAWGIVWVAGFAVMQFAPAAFQWVWAVGWAGALLWTFTRPRSAADQEAGLTWVAGVAFTIMLLVMIGADLRTAGLVFALAVAAGFTILGIWIGARFAVLGLAVAFSASAGWWLLPEWLFLILAVSGGGALIVGGQWLARP